MPPENKDDLTRLGERRAEAIRAALTERLAAVDVQVVDQTWQHRRHEGARDGRGHFDVTVVSARFEGQPLLARHRMVYDALSELIHTDIHALKIRAEVPASDASIR